MDEPMTNPRGSKPASPSRTYSDTDRSELNTPASTAPAVCASLVPAASGSHAAAAAAGLLENDGIRDAPSQMSAATLHRCCLAGSVRAVAGVILRAGAGCQVRPGRGRRAGAFRRSAGLIALGEFGALRTEGGEVRPEHGVQEAG